MLKLESNDFSSAACKASIGSLLSQLVLLVLSPRIWIEHKCLRLMFAGCISENWKLINLTPGSEHVDQDSNYNCERPSYKLQVLCLSWTGPSFSLFLISKFCVVFSGGGDSNLNGRGIQSDTFFSTDFTWLDQLEASTWGPSYKTVWS